MREIHRAFLRPTPAVLLVFRRVFADYPFGNVPRRIHTKTAIQRTKKDELRVKRLLCIDDSPEMLEVLVDLLQWEFLVVGTLSSGSLALDQAANFKPDIVLLDVDLGDISGFRVAEQLRSSGCPARIVFLSVHESIDFVRAAQDVGAVGYVFKSQITRDLVKTLHATF